MSSTVYSVWGQCAACALPNRFLALPAVMTLPALPQAHLCSPSPPPPPPNQPLSPPPSPPPSPAPQPAPANCKEEASAEERRPQPEYSTSYTAAYCARARSPLTQRRERMVSEYPPQRERAEPGCASLQVGGCGSGEAELREPQPLCSQRYGGGLTWPDRGSVCRAQPANALDPFAASLRCYPEPKRSRSPDRATKSTAHKSRLQDNLLSPSQYKNVLTRVRQEGGGGGGYEAEQRDQDEMDVEQEVIAMALEQRTRRYERRASPQRLYHVAQEQSRPTRRTPSPPPFPKSSSKSPVTRRAEPGDASVLSELRFLCQMTRELQQQLRAVTLLTCPPAAAPPRAPSPLRARLAPAPAPATAPAHARRVPSPRRSCAEPQPPTPPSPQAVRTPLARASPARRACLPASSPGRAAPPSAPGSPPQSASPAQVCEHFENIENFLKTHRTPTAGDADEASRPELGARCHEMVPTAASTHHSQERRVGQPGCAADRGEGGALTGYRSSERVQRELCPPRASWRSPSRHDNAPSGAGTSCPAAGPGRSVECRACPLYAAEPQQMQHRAPTSTQHQRMVLESRPTSSRRGEGGNSAAEEWSGSEDEEDEEDEESDARNVRESRNVRDLRNVRDVRESRNVRDHVARAGYRSSQMSASLTTCCACEHPSERYFK